ncbi:MAG TPA: hypothetical protein VLA34_01785, partial [Candidatus Krumholzibacterium sp.]|nr:hypothetical protein [Candidatus Krumholzibacterium sp.]
MRTIMIALTIALAVCALPGCEGEDPVNGEVPACGEDPVVYITYPNPEPVNLLTYVVDFMWVNSTDCDIQAVRYLAMPIDEDQDVISELNEDPGSFGDLWSDWRAYDGPRGRSVRLESELRPQSADCCGLTNARHVFAVQARARDGSVTEIFEDGRNAMIFDCRYRLYGPRIRVAEINFLGDLRQYGPYNYYPYPGATPSFEMPGGIALRFSFEADSEFYGRKVAGIRYGWDIADLDAWDEPYADVSLTP